MTQARQQFTSQELAIVLSHYDIGSVRDIQELTRGAHASAKVVVISDRGRFLLKRRPPGRDDPYRVAFAHALEKFLAQKHFPLPRLIGTREHNNSMLKVEGALYELFEYIEGGPYDGDLVATYEAGKTLGLYHRLVQDYHPEWDPPQGNYHNSPLVVDALPRVYEVLRKRPSAEGRKEELAALVKRIHDAYIKAARAVEAVGIEQWQTHIIHSDWHPGNMIFDAHHVVAVVDFDASRVGPRVLDVANGCLQFSTIAGGRDLSKWPPDADLQRVLRFLRGYDEIAVLSQAELQVVPLLMQEAWVAQSVSPILRTGTFAGLDGFDYLRVLIRKIEWLQVHRGQFQLDVEA